MVSECTTVWDIVKGLDYQTLVKDFRLGGGRPSKDLGWLFMLQCVGLDTQSFVKDFGLGDRRSSKDLIGWLVISTAMRLLSTP